MLELAKEISHLTEGQIEELYQRYIGGEKNSVLLEDYGIDVHPNNLINVLPPIVLNDQVCPYCEAPLFQRRQSKSSALINHQPIECLKCFHEIYPKSYIGSRYCRCDNCEDKRLKDRLNIEAEKREVIEKKYSLDLIDPVSYASLGFIDKITFLSLCIAQSDEGFQGFTSLVDNSNAGILSPNIDMSFDLITGLYDRNIIVVDPKSNISAFDEYSDYTMFDVRKVHWVSNVSLFDTGRSSLKDVYVEIYTNLADGFDPKWEDEVLKLLYWVSEEEVVQYLDVRASELDVTFKAYNKTREVVSQLLNDFSVSEIYYFAKKSVDDAHLFYARGAAKSKLHAGNTIPNKMRSLGERAIEEEWNVPKYSRDPRAPRSTISNVFYDFFLKGDDDGFDKCPRFYWEGEVYPEKFAVSSEPVDTLVRCGRCNSSSVDMVMKSGVIEICCADCGDVVIYKPQENK